MQCANFISGAQQHELNIHITSGAEFHVNEHETYEKNDNNGLSLIRLM
jgi:hypothetical protein